jgi:hypothetical protein
LTYPKSSLADDGASNQDVLELSGDNKAIVTTQVLKLIPHAKRNRRLFLIRVMKVEGEETQKKETLH